MERVDKEEAEEKDINKIERLPEGCISEILSLTSPADVCRSSLVSTFFKSVADSDVVWEKFLPANYQDIISRAFYPVSSSAASPSSKKELYYRLSDEPLLIDGGLKSLQLEKSSGKNCIMVGAVELAISWGEDPRYWRWQDNYSGSRFSKVPVLGFVHWLEIRGKLETRLLSTKTYYVAYLVFKLEDHWPYGFYYEPINAEVKVVGSNGLLSSSSQGRKIYLHDAGEPSIIDSMFEGQYFARERGDGWMEVEMGHFYNKGGDDDEVHMSMFEIESGISKGGLVVQGMELRPMVGTSILA